MTTDSPAATRTSTATMAPPRRGRPRKYTTERFEEAIAWATTEGESLRAAATRFDISLGSLNQYAARTAATRWATEFAVKVLDGIDVTAAALTAGIDPDDARLALAAIVDQLRGQP